MVRSFIAITKYREPGTARTRGATGNWYPCTATSRRPNASLDWPRNAPLLMSFRIRAVSDLLEPCAAKVASTVLRGVAGGDTRGLPGDSCLDSSSMLQENPSVSLAAFIVCGI